MKYKSSIDWENSKCRRLLLFGMSGVGKTHLSKLLRDSGGWFHYSVDYRIGTRYMGEHIVDNFKLEAMRNPFLADLLRSDSIYIASNITFGNLEPLSTYLGMPGDIRKGGIKLSEYIRRQRLHKKAEEQSLFDTYHFIHRAKELYDYDNFVCDSGGSICEVVEPSNINDPILKLLSRELLLVWIKGSQGHAAQLKERFKSQPKPMYYREKFLMDNWTVYLKDRNICETEVDPDDFSRWIYGRALDERQPRYAAMARNWGIEVDTDVIAAAKNGDDIVAIISNALDQR